MELSVGNVNASANSIVVVPVILTQADPLVSALQFRLTFPAGSLSVADEPAVFASTAGSDHSALSDSGAGEVSVVIFSSGLQTLASGSQPVAHVVLEVGGGGAGTELAVDIASAEASGPTGTAIPLVTEGGVVTISSEANSPLAGANRQVFPQIANGTFPGGVFSVSLVFLNRTAVEADARISFFKSDSNPFDLNLRSGESGTEFQFAVPASGSAFLATDGTGGLATGYAVLDSNVPLGGSLIFSWDSGTQIVTEAGVGASPVGTTFSIPILFTPGASNTGLALANFGGGSTDVAFVLKDKSGGEVATDNRSFEAEPCFDFWDRAVSGAQRRWDLRGLDGDHLVDTDLGHHPQTAQLRAADDSAGGRAGELIHGLSSAPTASGVPCGRRRLSAIGPRL